ncbi:copper transporter [Microaerobacter geothermalis]|uniref:copper transporter n=1 Tax=Microaerobacter geothermalis TaxID=674972 RepID=UPI001F2C7A39|nr:copper transporter [Microaerobacter geothermalis]MCF6094429.1 copper transporter [Microaerobacter geothermalis]
MVSLRFHIITIISVFLALGIGILLGGTMGGQWLDKNQQKLLQSLEVRYKESVAINQGLHKRLGELTTRLEQTNQDIDGLISQSYFPHLLNLKVLYLTSKDMNNLLTEETLKRVGIQVITMYWDRWMELEDWNHDLDLVISVDNLAEREEKLLRWLDKQQRSINWIQMTEPPKTPLQKWQLLQKINYASKKIWEDVHESVGVSNHSSF